jgi:hypothetical protein
MTLNEIEKYKIRLQKKFTNEFWSLNNGTEIV